MSNLLHRWHCPNWTIGLHGCLSHGTAPRGYHRLRRSRRKLHRSPGWLAQERLLRQLFGGPYKPRRWRLSGWRRAKGLCHGGRGSLHTRPRILLDAVLGHMCLGQSCWLGNRIPAAIDVRLLCLRVLITGFLLRPFCCGRGVHHLC